jgi:uncharacterized phage protein gp47/JayE
MPFTDSGFTRKTETEIIRDKEELYVDLFDVINNSVSDLLWQWMKVQSYERQEIENLIEIAMEMMSISNATGAFLDKWGIECGIERKGATKAEGYVEVSKTISGSDYTIPEGTQFTSSTNTYESDDEVNIPYQITMTKYRTGESNDYFDSTIRYVENIVEIIDENGNLIDPSYYSLNEEYNNHIEWDSESSAVIIQDEEYTVRVRGTITKRIEVSSVATGVDANAVAGVVTTCVQFPSLVVTNENAIEGGAIQETDTSYRARLLATKRRTFTLDRIRSLCLDVEGVRACKVYQNVGTDQSSVADWDNPTRGTPIEITGTTPLWSQRFVPGDQIATLGRITLHGMTHNDPPALICGIKSDTNYVGESVYHDIKTVEKYELDQSVTGMRDIEFNLKYNGMDKTKTYRFDIWCDDPDLDGFDWSTNYWIVDISTECYRDDSRGDLFEYDLSGSQWISKGTGYDLMFKTHFNGAGFRTIIAPDDGYGFTNLETEIETLLDYIDGGGHAPICIQSTIQEATEVLIDVKAVIWISELGDFNIIRTNIVSDIETYLENLNIGDNVVYSKIFYAIQDCTQVKNVKNVYIKKSTSDEWTQNDIGIQNDEIPDLGVRSIQLG